jgi:hypothetical protein
MRITSIASPETIGGKADFLDVVAITDTDSPYTVGEHDVVILANATNGAITVNLPAAADQLGRHLYIKKVDTSANAVTVDADSTELIDGATTAVLASRDAIEIVSDGTGWGIL